MKLGRYVAAGLNRGLEAAFGAKRRGERRQRCELDEKAVQDQCAVAAMEALVKLGA